MEKIISLNIRSLRSPDKWVNVQEILDSAKPLALCLQETWLDDKFSLGFNGYSFVRTDRAGGGGGGTAILVKKSASFDVINSRVIDGFEYTMIKLRLRGGWAVIASIYRIPSARFMFGE